MVELPVVLRDWYGWNTAIWVQNVGNETASVELNFVPQGNGNSATVSDTIPPGVSHGFFQASMPELSTSFRGFAQVSSIQPLAVVVEQWNSVSPKAGAYEGLSSAEFSSALFAPFQQREVNGWNSGVHLINPNSVSANVFSSYYNQNGSLIDENLNVISPASLLDLFIGITDVPAGFDGGLALSSDQPIGGLSNYQNNTLSGGDAFAISNLLPSQNATSIAALPRVANITEDGISTLLSIQNTSGSPAGITVHFFNPGGTETHALNDTIPAYGVRRYRTTDISQLGSAWEGSALIEANQPIFAEALQFITTAEAAPVDLGFRPNPDGYVFENYGGVNYTDYTIEDMRRMFGDEAVCIMVDSVCQPRPEAEIWNTRANQAMSGGHCDGMALTSLRFYQAIDDPADLQAGAASVHALSLENARRNIAYYFVEQLTQPVAGYKAQVIQNTPSEILQLLQDAMSGDADDPTTLFVRQAGVGGHAITPYAIEDRGGGIFWVSVYDNNHPDDANRHVEINTNGDTWSYNLGWNTWSGDADTHSLGVVPVSIYGQQPVCPWCAGSVVLASAAAGSEVWSIGAGHLLITDTLGRAIGYRGDQFVSEIPGAFETVVDGGLGVELEPIYNLPLSEDTEILLDGGSVSQAGTASIAKFGPGYAVSVDEIPIALDEQDHLTISADGKTVAYSAANSKEADFSLAQSNSTEGEQFQVLNGDVGAGQVMTFTVSTTTGEFIIDNSKNVSGTYDLAFSRLSSTGEQLFTHYGLEIDGSDTHILNYSDWDGTGGITIDVDQGSDGTIDETLELENQTFRIFLSFVR